MSVNRLELFPKCYCVVRENPIRYKIYPGCLIEQIRTEKQSNSIEQFSFDWAWSNIKRWCEFRINQTNRTKSNAIEPNPVPICSESISWCLKQSIICRNNHDQPLLICMNKQELRNWTFRYGSIEFDCGPFSTQHWIAFHQQVFLVSLIMLHLLNPIERLMFHGVRLPNFHF